MTETGRANVEGAPQFGHSEKHAKSPLQSIPIPSPTMLVRAFLYAIVSACVARPETATAQAASRDTQRDSIMAVVDSALSAINANNLVALADLMVPEAQMYPVGGRRN